MVQVIEEGCIEGVGVEAGGGGLNARMTDEAQEGDEAALQRELVGRLHTAGSDIER